MTEPKNRQRIVVAGASGFIGSQLIEKLLPNYDVVGLTRYQKESTRHLSWRQCDLFSLLQAENALRGADYAFYLVHSMMPTSHLTQASFEDMDLILADNFARAAAREGIKQIVYLGGIIPNSEHLSRHLRSRQEVEETLASHGVPVTTLRASVIVGPRGSSFQMIEKLVRRLPIMLCPSWTNSLTQPIALDDAIDALSKVVGQGRYYHRAYDIGGADIVSYLELLRMTAQVMGKRRLILPVPFLSPKISYFWLSLVTGSPYELTSPLVESLKDSMVARNLELQQAIGQTPRRLQPAIQAAITQHETLSLRAKARVKRKQYRQSVDNPEIKDVRSVQRLNLPPGKDAVWLAEKYTIWLPRYLRPFIRVRVDHTRKISFFIMGIAFPLLEMSYSENRSTPDRTLFYITGGLLAQQNTGLRGRLEFREVLGGRYVLAAIHDFTPSLPWFIYNQTQARVHLWVMHAFQRYLKKMDVMLY